MFSLTIDAPKKLIRTTFEGFLSIPEVMEWSRQEQAAAAVLCCRANDFLLYVDTSRCAIQSQEVVALFQQLIATAEFKALRIAIMQGSSLTKMQTRRIVAGTNHIAHFTDQVAAEAWLAANATPIVDASRPPLRQGHASGTR